MMLQLQKSNRDKHSKSTGTTKKSKQLSCLFTRKSLKTATKLK